jgi:hypothetical protein
MFSSDSGGEGGAAFFSQSAWLSPSSPAPEPRHSLEWPTSHRSMAAFPSRPHRATIVLQLCDQMGAFPVVLVGIRPLEEPLLITNTW